jgi:outer membrane protein assembly factor BamB
LSYHPVVVGELVLWSNHRYVYAFDLKTGKPAFPNDPSKPAGVIFDIETNVSQSVRPHRGLGVPRFTLTVHDDKIYARLGSQVTSRPVDAFEQQQGYLVCLDLAAEGKLLWPWPLTSTADRWSYEGAPVVDGSNVYIAMRRSDVRPQAYVACLDAETGQQRWRTFICSAETPGGGQSDEITHNLLTLNEGVLYLNTNLGAVAALSAREGRIKWIRLYNRARKVNVDGIDHRAQHFYRDLNPCVYCQGLVYVAPTDSEWILALDAATGQIAWESRLPEDAIHLLGVSEGTLMASGNKLWWLDAAGGKVKAQWPGMSPSGYGRGVIAEDQVLWTSRDALYSFNLSVPGGSLPSMRRSSMQLTSVYHATGGNLVLARDRLLLATPNKLYAFGVTPPRATLK